MKIRRPDREVLQEKRRAKRRYPFDSETRLCDLVKTNCYEDIRDLVEHLRPYLQGVVGTYSVSRLYFDLEKISGIHKFVYGVLAEFLVKVIAKGGLKKPLSVFFRYLASPDHCNLGVSEQSLKALITRAMKAYF